MSEPIEAAPGDPLPEVTPSAYPPDAEPLEPASLTEDDLKGDKVHPQAPGDEED